MQTIGSNRERILKPDRDYNRYNGEDKVKREEAVEKLRLYCAVAVAFGTVSGERFALTININKIVASGRSSSSSRDSRETDVTDLYYAKYGRL